MPVNPSDLDDTTPEGAAWPDDPKGWQTMQFAKFRADAKGKRTWFLMEFSNGDGARASASLNLFSKPETDGEKQANQISLRTLKSFFTAAGLADADMPAPTAAAIAKALNAYEGSAQVDAFCGPDGRGYTQVTKFRKASAAV